MATAAALMVLFAWLFAVYHFGRYLYRNPSRPRPGADQPAPALDVHRLDLGRLRRDMALAWSHDSPPDELGEWPPEPPGSPGDLLERREAELARQLLAGTLDATEYRRQMADLVQRRAPSSGTP